MLFYFYSVFCPLKVFSLKEKYITSPLFSPPATPLEFSYVSVCSNKNEREGCLYLCVIIRKGKRLPACSFLTSSPKVHLPFLITASQFSFSACKFNVQKSKEGTGRVVMWKMGIRNSFTLEATFCGSTLGNCPCRPLPPQQIKVGLAIRRMMRPFSREHILPT